MAAEGSDALQDLKDLQLAADAFAAGGAGAPEACMVCQSSFLPTDFSSRRATRYLNHCPKCSLELRAILTASKGTEADSAAGGGGDSTAKYLQTLARDEPEKYRKVFAEWRDASSASKRGRGHQRQPFNPRTAPGLNVRVSFVWVRVHCFLPWAGPDSGLFHSILVPVRSDTHVVLGSGKDC